LLNLLTGADVLAEDKLFATLDPVSRRINVGGGDILLVDTVGFINKLPHDLVNAFRATLEEARHADVLLHVVDASSEARAAQIEVVGDVLHQLQADQNPTIMVYNKCDIAPGGTAAFTGGEAIGISAKSGDGMDRLTDAITAKISEMRVDVTAVLPSSAGALISHIYASGQVHSCEYLEDGVHITCTVSREDAGRISKVQL
jgi:GTP-binding protein HflX